MRSNYISKVKSCVLKYIYARAHTNRNHICIYTTNYKTKKTINKIKIISMDDRGALCCIVCIVVKIIV